jgi:hypothetical protein
MKPEEQRVAIAEACGHGDYSTRMNGWHDDQIEGLPNYLNDLNEMHEAEKILDDEAFGDYRHYLIDKLKTSWGVATAAERAEAFLKALDIWKG